MMIFTQAHSQKLVNMHKKKKTTQFLRRFGKLDYIILIYSFDFNNK